MEHAGGMLDNVAGFSDDPNVMTVSPPTDLISVSFFKLASSLVLPKMK
jgi:hypothetical protein